MIFGNSIFFIKEKQTHPTVEKKTHQIQANQGTASFVCSAVNIQGGGKHIAHSSKRQCIPDFAITISVSS